MDNIRDIVDSVVRGCALGGLEVQELLAAFVARTVVEESATTFSLDKPITESRKDEVILRSIEKLLERDNPSLEVMMMQVDYDTSFLKEDVEAQRILRVRNRMIATHKMGIVEVVMEDAHDFEALTTLYRKIFRFLLDYAPNAKSHDRLVEREVAAALESVFPRVGLKAFLSLTAEERSAQLLELGRITLGIRLYNRSEGRGGAGIDNMDKDANMLSRAMVRDIDREVEFFADACNKYQIAIVRAHCAKRKDIFIKEKAEAKALLDKQRGIDANDYKQGSNNNNNNSSDNNDNIKIIPDEVITRWSAELSNRRQYLSFLRTLQDEVKNLQEKIGQFVDSIDLEISNIKTLVTNKSSVPKEKVYPRFDALGYLWIRLYEEVLILTARANTFRTLCQYRLSFNPTLTEEYYDETDVSLSLGQLSGFAQGLPKGVTGGGSGDDGSSGNVSGPTSENQGDGSAEVQIATAGKQQEQLDAMPNENNGGDIDTNADAKQSNYESKGNDDSNTNNNNNNENRSSIQTQSYGNGTHLLSVHNSPDFMLLPLELQGFCPWTIVHAKGLLIPGKPNLGVVRYDNMYFVCDHEQGLHAFMKNPDYYLNQIRLRALHHPEYIHLLRLQRWFPSTSIARLLEQNDFDPRAVGGQPATRDASTGTPTHFVESYIDFNYHWNEWELRRRALKVVALKNCATSSSQTDNSHFRRDNVTQVYEQREHETQTRREKGTNPPKVTTFIAGLRGALPQDADAVSKYIKPNTNADSKEEEKDLSFSTNDAKESKRGHQHGARVIHLSLDI